MSTEGVMAKIRDLLTQGWSAPEIINQGYAPSTVYRLQQEFRKRQPQAERPVLQVDLTRSSEVGDSEPLLPRLEELEGIVVQLQARLQRQERVAAGLRELGEALEQLQQDLSQESNTRAKLQALTRRIDAELDDLAQIYRDDVIFGSPRWRRRSD